MTTIQVQAQDTPRRLIAKVGGDADASQADELARQFRAIAATRPAMVVLDLSDVTSVDSAAMGVLMQFKRQVAETGGQVTLAAPRPMLLEALRHVGFQHIFEIEPTVEGALGGATIQ